MSLPRLAVCYNRQKRLRISRLYICTSSEVKYWICYKCVRYFIRYHIMSLYAYGVHTYNLFCVHRMHKQKTRRFLNLGQTYFNFLNFRVKRSKSKIYVRKFYFRFLWVTPRAGAYVDCKNKFYKLFRFKHYKTYVITYSWFRINSIFLLILFSVLIKTAF